jgi:hypothetical protein
MAENMTAAKMLANVVDFSKSCSNHCTICSPGTSLSLVAPALAALVLVALVFGCSTAGSGCMEGEWFMAENVASLT